jgi:predicted type IV restriction endonuclease
MDLADRIRELAARIPKQLDFIQTEEATKNALIMPFITCLGYNVFDPTEVTPELIADIGIKKGEKVDYAILKEGKPIILFECKSKDANLNKEHASQLHRYFHVTDARFGVLTNGIIYRFFTDLEKENAMDQRPFLEVNILALKDQDIEELKKFAKGYFDVQNVLTTANELKYVKEIKRILVEESRNPTPEFIKHFAGQIYHGRMTQNATAQFSDYVSQAIKQFVSDHVNERLQSALNADSSNPVLSSIQEDANEVINEPKSEANAVETTKEEIEAYFIVKSLVRTAVDSSRIIMRDVQSYCGILLDDNNRKPICRFRFGTKKMQLGLFGDADRTEEIVNIAKIDDIYEYADRLRNTALMYDAKPQS